MKLNGIKASGLLLSGLAFAGNLLLSLLDEKRTDIAITEKVNDAVKTALSKKED